jgi:outer membrane protein, multidrug efflux system
LALLVVGAAWLLSGCAVGPNYKRPSVNSPARFRSAPDNARTNSLADLNWWELYQDATLNSLIRTALTNNYDLRIAITRVEQAKAVAVQARSQFVPGVGYQGEVSRGRNEFLGNPSPAGPAGPKTGDAVFAALSASWEIDFWGRIRRLNESARASFLASEEGRRTVQLSLVAGVAQAYFELLELDRRLEIARRTTESFRDSAKIFNDRFEAGGASRLDTSRAEAALASTAANVPDLERQIALKENELSVLLGQNPGPITRTSSLSAQVLPPEVPAGLPSALLERRPDIRQAEQNLRASNAQVGVSVAEFFPKLGITTFMGKVSPELSAFTAGSANAWSAVGSMSGPIFQGGALVGQYRESKAKREEARLRYEQTTLNAFQEVSDALIAREKLEAIRIEQARAVKAYEDAVQLSLQRYTDGKAAYFEVLEAQQQLFPAENSLARTELNQLLVVVQLYKALGGGWESASDVKVASQNNH